MKILIYSPMFYPSIGGLEAVMSILAHQFVAEGHQVKVVCKTKDIDNKKFPFEIVRFPKPNHLLKLLKWSDVYFQGNVSLKGVYPLLIQPKPCVISHHGWYTRTNGQISWQDKLKHLVTKFVTNISVSQAVAEHLTVPSTVIPNPYREEIFYEIPQIPRNKNLVFLGRFVSDKGVDLLIKALANLRQQRLTPSLTMIGKGVEEENLRKLTQELNLTDQVNFVGPKVEQELAKILNEHQIMVVPSLWNEPFGIVALEGIACGCVVVGSSGGGLKEAIGDCGLTFPNGDIIALTQALKQLLTQPSLLDHYRANATKHLKKHQKAIVAKAYLEVLEKAIS
ncbi:glycosyltransferase family 4 protein [Synechocystis sp. B12]|nr:glycosyltransferase family 4 protein [Synechocystis sp. B12]